jgi:predicted enzyme related to lactoylglutathione lyase
MPRPIHFELTADDPARAAAFYEKAFGWKSSRWEGPFDYWLVSTGPEGEPGIDGGITKRREGGSGTTNTIGVESVDAAVEAVTAAGGKVVQPKAPIPGVGWLAMCTDTEGNVFGVMQPDPGAGT